MMASREGRKLLASHDVHDVGVPLLALSRRPDGGACRRSSPSSRRGVVVVVLHHLLLGQNLAAEELMDALQKGLVLGLH